MADWYEWRDDELILTLRVQPKSSRDRIAGVENERLKIHITAPPVDGEANEYLRAFLGKTFRVAKSRVRLVSGATGRDKRIGITAPENWPEFLAEITQIKKL